MQVLVRPLTAEAFHEHIRFGHAVPQQVLIVRQRPTHFPVQLWVLDLVDELARLHNVREAAERIVEVLERGPRQN